MLSSLRDYVILNFSLQSASPREFNLPSGFKKKKVSMLGTKSALFPLGSLCFCRSCPSEREGQEMLRAPGDREQIKKTNFN